jgi:hypothetical protein
MAKQNQHVVPHNGEWAVRGEGNSRITSVHDTQTDAIEAARDIAIRHKAEVVVHRPDGRIRDKDSYDGDPFPANCHLRRVLRLLENHF